MMLSPNPFSFLAQWPIDTTHAAETCSLRLAQPAATSCCRCTLSVGCAQLLQVSALRLQPSNLVVKLHRRHEVALVVRVHVGRPKTSGIEWQTATKSLCNMLSSLASAAIAASTSFLPEIQLSQLSALRLMSPNFSVSTNVLTIMSMINTNTVSSQQPWLRLPSGKQ